MGFGSSTASTSYTGQEEAIPERHVREASSDDRFQIKSSAIPAGCVPIFDEEQAAVVGYRGPLIGGMTRIYDLDGHQVGLEEVGLETPLIDPIDLILIFGSVVRLVSRGLYRIGAAVVGEAAGDVAAHGVSAASLSLLRLSFRKFVTRELKFTATTAARMANPGRYVPVHILKLAIRYGKRAPDPQGVAGAFRYTVKMLREPKYIGGPAREYTLQVVIRESDFTVLHFHYE